jgi:DNA repair protein SbcC/Rad50
MLKKVILENFQAHEHSEINFTEGINVICGASDQGKSSVIRAIRWVLENRPSGFSFKKEGATKPTRVTLVFDDGNRIVRERSEAENCYKIYYKDKRPMLMLKALRSDVPDEVSAVSKFGPYNIQHQTSGAFLLDDSAGEVAKKLNALSGVSVIDAILKETNQRIKTAKVQETTITDMLKQAKLKKASFRNLPKAEKILESIGKQHKECEEFKFYSRQLLSLVYNLKIIESAPVIPIDKIESMMNSASQHSQDLIKYSDARERLSGLIENLKKADYAILRLKNTTAAAKHVSEARSHLKQLEEYRTHALELRSKLEKLKTVSIGFNRAKEEIQDSEKALEIFKKENKTCPVCSKKW